jgi:hypothetical protein
LKWTAYLIVVRPIDIFVMQMILRQYGNPVQVFDWYLGLILVFCLDLVEIRIDSETAIVKGFFI